MQIEIWKDIKGYEGLYQISNYGNVKNQYGKILKPFDNSGYLRIGLYKNGKSKKYLIHRLVASHFISEPPFDNAEVNHKDFNRKNNHVDNLEWVTPKENSRHAFENKDGLRAKAAKSMSKIGKKYGHIGVEKSKKPVMQIDRNTGEILAIFESAREAARRTGSNYKNISQVCLGEKKTHNGYIWRFADREGQTTIESNNKCNSLKEAL